jgi:uncharacterized YigZ family protein
MLHNSNYLTPSHTQQCELIIKRSRFITTVGHVNNRVDAKQFIQQVRGEYLDASHHCWAHIVGAPSAFDGVDQSDDGEPKGIAGKPILNVLQYSGLGNVVLIVTRYFGGVKLGAGGLVRAYSQSASQAIQVLETREHIVCQTVSLLFSYHLQGKVDYYLTSNDIEIIDQIFSQQVCFAIAAPHSKISELQNDLNQLANGEIVITFEKG